MTRFLIAGFHWKVLCILNKEIECKPRFELHYTYRIIYNILSLNFNENLHLRNADRKFKVLFIISFWMCFQRSYSPLKIRFKFHQ